MNQTQPRARIWDLLVRVVQELFDDMRDALEAFKSALMDDALEAGAAKLPRATLDARRIARALDRAESHAIEALRLRATLDMMHRAVGLSVSWTSLDDSLGEVLERVERYCEDARYFAAAALQREDIPSGTHRHVANLREMFDLLRSLLTLDSHDADHLPRSSAAAIVEYADGCACDRCAPSRQRAAADRDRRAALIGRKEGTDAN